MNKIKQLRQNKNLKQGELALLLGIAQPTLSGWETGARQIDKDNLKKLSDIFNVSIDYILGYSDQPNPPQPDKPTTQQPIYPQEVINLAEKIQKLPPEVKLLILQQIKVFEAMDKK